MTVGFRSIWTVPTLSILRLIKSSIIQPIGTIRQRTFHSLTATERLGGGAIREPRLRTPEDISPWGFPVRTTQTLLVCRQRRAARRSLKPWLQLSGWRQLVLGIWGRQAFRRAQPQRAGRI